jgi:hypothetical protein
MVIMLAEVPPLGEAAHPSNTGEGIFGQDSDEGWAT